MGNPGRGYSKVKKTKRGTTNNDKRLDMFKNKVGERGSADWGGADPKVVLTVIEQMSKLGGAVTFGLSRDGGAYMLTLLLDGEKSTLWYNGSVEIDVELRELIDTMEEIGE